MAVTLLISWKVELFGFHLFEYGLDAEISSFVLIEQGGEYAGGVKAGETHKVDGTIQTCQGHCLQVTYDPIVFNWLIIFANSRHRFDHDFFIYLIKSSAIVGYLHLIYP